MDQSLRGKQPVRVAGGLGGVVRHSLTYMTGSVAYKAIALLAIPILARLLTPAELGLLDLAALIASVVSLLAGLGLDTAIARFQPSEDPGRLWATAAGILIAGAIASVVVGLATAEILAVTLVGNASHVGLLAAAVVYGVVLAGIGFALTFVRLTDHPGVYARYAFLIVAAQMSVAIGIAAAVPHPLPAVVWGWTAASVIGIALLLWREHMPLGGFDRDLGARLFRFGAPLVPAAVVWIAGDLGIRAVVANNGTLAALGSYGIAARLVSIMGLFVAAFGLAWHPYVFRIPRETVAGDSQRALIQVIGGMGIVAILISAVAPEAILAIAGPGYGPAARAVPGMAGSLVALGVMTLVSGVVALGRGTTLVAVASGLGALIQVGGALLFVPPLGLAGAALGAALGYGLAMMVLLRHAKFLALEGSCAVFVATAAVALVSSLVAMQLVNDLSLGVRLGSGLLAVMVLACVCYLAWLRLPDRIRPAG